MRPNWEECSDIFFNHCSFLFKKKIRFSDSSMSSKQKKPQLLSVLAGKGYCL